MGIIFILKKPLKLSTGHSTLIRSVIENQVGAFITDQALAFQGNILWKALDHEQIFCYS